MRLSAPQQRTKTESSATPPKIKNKATLSHLPFLSISGDSEVSFDLFVKFYSAFFQETRTIARKLLNFIGKGV